MNSVIDIFVKLIIAVIGIVAPMIFALVAIIVKKIPELAAQLVTKEKESKNLKARTIDGYQKAIDAYIAKLKEAGKNIEEDQSIKDLEKNQQKEGDKETTAYAKTISDLRFKLNLLSNLRTQISLVFGLLIVALIFLMIFQLVYSCFHDCFCLPIELHNWVLVGTFILSAICFSLALRRLWQLSGIIIENEMAKITNQPVPERGPNEPEPGNEN